MVYSFVRRRKDGINRNGTSHQRRSGMNREGEHLIRYLGSEGERRIQEMFGTGRRAMAFYQNQMMSELNVIMQSFIARQEMVFIATANARGECDSSFRAGTAGFVNVLDSRTLAYPEYGQCGQYHRKFSSRADVH